jgi:lysophospholipase L1-like esterase
MTVDRSTTDDGSQAEPGAWADESDLRYTRVERLLPARLSAAPSRAVEAALLGPDAAEYEAVRARCEALVAGAVRELARDREVRSLVARLALPASTQLLFVGDSRLADWQSWPTILVALLRELRADVALRVVDVSLPGSTSIDALARVARLPRGVRPDWMFVAVGGNDSLRITSAPEDRLVTRASTRHALAALVRWARSRDVPHDPIWVAPGFILPDIDPAEGFVQDVADFAETDELIRGLSGAVVDTEAILRALPAAFMPDGRHFTIAAQQAIARATLVAWAGAAQPPRPADRRAAVDASDADR